MNESTEGLVRANMIIEILGHPKEHLVATLEEIAKKMGEEKGVQVLNQKIKEPEEIKEKKGFYSSFMDIEIETEGILYLAILLFKYMPAHVEISSPEVIALQNTGINDLFNELTRRLHGYDEIAKVLQFQNMQLKQKLEEVMKNNSCGDDCCKNKTPKKDAALEDLA
jgi:hypothetical protein